tara:strand:+ start:262 stop:1041 length:780 start_codon:yes stop_codon:yes gene_type:complete
MLPTATTMSLSYIAGTALHAPPVVSVGFERRAAAHPVLAVGSWYDAGERLAAGTVVDAGDSCPIVEETYYCNEQGCWIGAPPPVEPVVLPDGRTFCPDLGVQSHSKFDQGDGKVVPTKTRKPAPTGVFAPLVVGTKRVMGEKELNKLRAQVIAEHTKVISGFVDTSESKFGQIVLKQMFEAADKDGNGTLDREEVKAALKALGFTFVKDKQIEQIFSRGDVNDDEVIDFEEFVAEAPKTLRTSLVKLAKQNGHDLGFLA